MQGYYYSDINNTCYYTINGNYMCYNNNVIENMDNNNDTGKQLQDALGGNKYETITGYECNAGVDYPGNNLGVFGLVKGTTDDLLNTCQRICNKNDLCKGFVTNTNSCTFKTEFEGTPQTANIDPTITQTYEKKKIHILDKKSKSYNDTTIDTFVDNPQIEGYTFQKNSKNDWGGNGIQIKNSDHHPIINMKKELKEQVQENFVDKPKKKGYMSELSTEYGGNDWGGIQLEMDYVDKVDILDLCSTGCSTNDNCVGFTYNTTTKHQCFMKTAMNNPTQDKNRNAFKKSSLDLY